MLGQRSSIAIIPIVAIMMFSLQEDMSFVVGYMVLLGSFFCLSTLSYDAFENGMAHLLTLPFKRKTYIYEKYLFILGTAALLGLVTMLCGIVLNRNNAAMIQTLWQTTLIFIAIIILMISFMLPIQLKFGPEKSRFITIIMAAIIGAVGFGMKTLLGDHIDMEGLLNSILSLSAFQAAILAVLFIAAILLLSIAVSVKILENKEY